MAFAGRAIVVIEFVLNWGHAGEKWGYNTRDVFGNICNANIGPGIPVIGAEGGMVMEDDMA